MHGFVHETLRDGLRRGRPRPIGEDMHSLHAEGSAPPPETTRDGRDGRRMAHNPEVAGSNPAPAAGSSDARRGLARAAACVPWIRDQSAVSGGWEYVPAGRDAHPVPGVCRPLTEVGRIRIQNGCRTAVTRMHAKTAQAQAQALDVGLRIHHFCAAIDQHAPSGPGLLVIVIGLPCGPDLAPRPRRPSTRRPCGR